MARPSSARPAAPIDGINSTISRVAWTGTTTTRETCSTDPPMRPAYREPLPGRRCRQRNLPSTRMPTTSALIPVRECQLDRPARDPATGRHETLDRLHTRCNGGLSPVISPSRYGRSLSSASRGQSHPGRIGLRTFRRFPDGFGALAGPFLVRSTDTLGFSVERDSYESPLRWLDTIRQLVTMGRRASAAPREAARPWLRPAPC